MDDPETQIFFMCQLHVKTLSGKLVKGALISLFLSKGVSFIQSLWDLCRLFQIAINELGGIFCSIQ